MSQAQYDELTSVMHSGPLIMLPCGYGMSQQEHANLAWDRLGKELGFKHMTVLPGTGKLDFTAEVDESFAPPAAKSYEKRLLDGFRAKGLRGETAVVATKAEAEAVTPQHDRKIFGSEATMGEFYAAVDPVMELINKYFDPHTRVIIDCTNAEILSGIATHNTMKFVKD
jgi:hypothetical protein